MSDKVWFRTGDGREFYCALGTYEESVLSADPEIDRIEGPGGKVIPNREGVAVFDRPVKVKLDWKDAEEWPEVIV